MSIDVRPVCQRDNSGCIVEMEQTVNMVLDIERSKRPYDNPIPRPVPVEEIKCDTSKSYSSPEACFPLDVSATQFWSLSEVFGRTIQGSCLATDSKGQPTESVCINIPDGHQIHSSEGSIERKDSLKIQRCYTLSNSEPFELVLPEQESQAVTPRPLPSIYASRSFIGHGQERGGVQTLLTNPSSKSAISFVYFETLPWFMKPYLHTLKAQTTTSPSPPQNELITSIYYRPALDRQRGTHLELQLQVPPASTIRLTYDFEKAILRYTEYPPDANRGFDVAPAVIRLLANNSDTSAGLLSEVEYLRTTSLLLSLPTPDFSMPYNVIILTSTVMALAFGSIYQLCVRRFVGADEVEGFDFGKIKARLRGRLKVLMGRFGGREKKMQ
ncbi:MAG: hypothetical protein Q9220_000531 [cf. Caloplaca sp. 1 TL-2023]